MTVRGLALAVVTSSRGSRLVDLLAAAGATVREVAAGEHVESLELSVDAIVLDVGAHPEAFAAFAAGLAACAGETPAPIACVDGALTAARCAALGPMQLVEEIGDDDELVRRIDAAVARARTADGSSQAERAQALAKRLEAMVKEARTAMHDAGVLCNVALGYGANMRDGFAGGLSEAQAGHVAHILSALESLAGLLERFSGSARALAEVNDAPPASVRRLPRRRQRIDFCGLVRDTVSLFSTLADDRAIRLSVEGSEPAFLWGDPTQLKQVVINLVVNAIKFTPAGGRVRVGVQAGAFDAARVRRGVRLVVADSGMGIAPEERERVFDRGYRVAHHADVPGTGIGLAVVRDVVALHGGRVSVEDAEEGGAALVAVLPVDLRRRREAGVAIVDDVHAAKRVVDELVAHGVDELCVDPDTVLALLGECQAIVAIPRPGFTSAEVALRAASGGETPPPPESRRGGGR